MTYDPHKHHRRSIRLKGYDYSQDGIYFVTIRVKNGLCLFGDVIDGEMILNPAGEMVEQAWLALPERFPQAELDVFRAMPNHFHGLLGTRNANLQSVLVGAGLMPALDWPDHDGDRVITTVAPSVVVGDMVGAFKSITTNEYIVGVRELGWEPFPGKLWQRNFYEHIVRNERALNAIREYIINNPANWEADQLHPNATRNKFNITRKKK
jgi:REP element-mobilizing transposase RayT